MKTIKRYSGICSMWLAAVTSLATLSCADDWDNHYQGAPQPEKTIWETIESRPDLKDFADLLRKKGYDKYLNTTQRYTVWAPKGKIDTTVMLVPTAETIYSSSLPMSAPYFDQTTYIKSFYDTLQNVNTVDAYAVLSAHQNEYIYYRTDHHWTSYGAYLGYTALAKSLNLKAATHDMFNIEHVANDFLGTLYSKALCHEDFADAIDLYTYSQGDPVSEVVRYMGKNTQTYSSLFFRENLEGKDKYTVFLGQNAPVVKINTNIKNGKKLIVFKDSYANSIMQFLTLHYEEIAVVDLRYLNVPLSEYQIDLNDYQQALFLYNVGTFTDDQSMRKLAGC